MHSVKGDGKSDAAFLVAGQRPARTLFETWLYAELADAGFGRRATIVNRLTERWLREELQQGAASADIGLWGPDIARREVESLLRDLEGDFIHTLPAPALAAAVPAYR